MELLENLELMNVEFENSNATLTFLDEYKGEIREVTFKKSKFDQGTQKWIFDQDAADRVEGWCQEHFGLEFDRLAEAIGERKDVYAYDTFNALEEFEIFVKFSEDEVGEIFQTEITGVEDNGNKILIKYNYDDKARVSNMAYSTFDDARNKYFVNPTKRTKQYTKFEEKFHVSVEKADEIVGKSIMVEVKKFGVHTFGDVKPFPKKK